MKKLSIIFFLAVTFFSCKKIDNFLEKAPGVDIDENTVFSNRQNVERYLATLYQFGMTSNFNVRTSETGLTGAGITYLPNSLTLTSNYTDESEASESWSYSSEMNNGSLTPQNIVLREDMRYYLRWQAIRSANIILERINEVPNADEVFKREVAGEALFMRALCYFDMMKRYGGLPIVTKRIVNMDEAKIPRGTFEETINLIVRDCDEAVAKLPNLQPAAFTGRATKGAALALKARTLLYAASPLFNTATPYLSLGSAQDDKLICYGNYDANRWKIAAEASDKVIEWAATAGVSLIDDPTKRAPLLNNTGAAVVGNYRTAWEQTDNQEIIMSSKIWGAAKGDWAWPWQMVLPRNDYVPNASAGGGWVGVSPTFNFVSKYEKRDGTPQTWNPAGGNDLLQKYAELDPRFIQTVVFTGARLHASVTRVQIWEGALANKNNTRGGHMLLKWIPDGIRARSNVVNDPIFRLNEFYLNAAEAWNEFEGPVNAQKTYEYVNRIRTRSGMPNLPTGLTKDQFRQRVRNERTIELAFEDHRLHDVRRWMIAEQDGVMNGQMWGLEIQKLNNGTPPTNFPTAFSYKPFVFETRTFPRKMYLWPFIESEVLKGNLKQNPGW